MKIILLTFILSFSALGLAQNPKEGEIAPNFEIKQMDGKTFKLSDYKGKQSVYLVFWNAWCTNCFKKIPQLKEIQTNLADKIKIIAINTTRKDSMEASLAFKEKFEINYQLAFDYGKKVTDLYTAKFVPYAFIIDINGIIRHRDNIPDDISAHLTNWNTLQQNIAVNP